MKKLELKEKFMNFQTTISDNGSIIVKGSPMDIWNFFEPHLKLKEPKAKLNIPEEAIITYNELFPNIKGGSGKRLRCNVKELEKAFQYFFKLYPDTNWQDIFKATDLYLTEQEKDNFKWTRTAKYFCVKFKQLGQPESELIEFVERIKEGDNFEDKQSTAFEPKILE